MMKSVALCCGIALLATAHVVGGQQSLPLVGPGWGSANAGLRMSISPVVATERAEQPAFYIAIENVGDSDVVLNLGFMLSNGKVMFPEAVQLRLADSEGTTRELRYFDRRYPRIAGRVDDLIVALRAGSVYAIRVSMDHYLSSGTKDVGQLAGGRYRIEARFEGQGARALNLDTSGIGLLNFWKGTLRSNSLVFEVP